MTKLTPWLLCLLVGFALGWWGALRWVSTPPKAAPPVIAQNADEWRASVPQSSVDQPAPIVADAFQADQPEAMISYLESTELDPVQRQTALQQLDDFLLQLQSSDQWRRLSIWLQPLHAWDSRYRLWQDLLASAYIALNQPRDALLILFESHASTLSSTRRQQLMDDIEALLAEQLEKYQALTPTHLSHNTELMSLLLLALEKQPEHAPFGLMLAQVYERSGEWAQALFQLQLLPYSERYQVQIEENMVRLEQLLADQQRAQEGIVLQRSGGQFIATVVFDDRVELNLMIDTGATITALNERAIALLQQHTGLHTTDQRVQVNTANGVVESPLYEIGNVRVGDWEQSNVQLLQVNLPSDLVDGLLGMNFLSRYAFSIDQEQGLLFLDSK